MWEAPTLTEIAIPSSLLPQYSSTINFGYYLGGDIITDVADCSEVIHDPDDPDDPTPTPAPYNDGSEIVIDGDYHDWDYYPVITIQYDSSGMENTYNDADGSIYQRDGDAYVHCIANEFSKQDTGWKYGAEFLEVTVIFGYDHTKLIAVELGPDGSLDWVCISEARCFLKAHITMRYSISQIRRHLQASMIYSPVTTILVRCMSLSENIRMRQSSGLTLQALLKQAASNPMNHSPYSFTSTESDGPCLRHRVYRPVLFS